MVAISLILHFFIFAFFGLKATLFSTDTIQIDPSIKVTMVGLPDKIAHLPEPPTPKAEPLPPKPEEKAAPIPPKAEVKPVPAAKPVVLHPKVDTRDSLKSIKEMEKEEKRKEALQAIQNEVQAEEKKAERQAKVAQILKGNIVNNGSALHGLMKADFQEYIGDVQNHIHEHWNLPEWLTNANLKATVVVFLDSQGNVVKRAVRKSSGDERFDNYTLKAVDEASPFPKPPEKFVDLLKNDGIAIGFPQ